MAEAPDPPQNDPQPEESFMTAKFKCANCGHGWISIRSLNLPEKCKECKTKGCEPVAYQKSTRPEQLQGKKMIMVAKYKCDLCQEKWKSINSAGKPKPCPACKKRGTVHFVKPYKYRKAKPEELRPKRKFGFFACKKCGKEWPSAYTWVGKYQECRDCGSKVYAHAIQPLKHGRGGGFQKPHDQARCEKCKELGYNCRGYIAPSDAHEVLFEDGQSIISVASSTSTEPSQDQRDDVTPTVSDDEGDIVRVLEEGTRNLHM